MRKGKRMEMRKRMKMGNKKQILPIAGKLIELGITVSNATSQTQKTNAICFLAYLKPDL